MGQRSDEVEGLGRYAPTEGAAGEAGESQADEPKEIRSDIEHTRAEMSQTIDAIQEKLNPETLRDQAVEAVREATVGRAEETVSNAFEMAEEAVNSASETAREAGYSVIDTIKQNPVPSLLAGLGLGWLYTNRVPSRRPRRGYYGYEYDVPRRPRGYGGSGSDYGREARERLDDVTERVGETAGRAQERVGEMAGDAGEFAREAGSTVGDIVRENPVPTALVSLGLGWLFMNSGAPRNRDYDVHGAAYKYGGPRGAGQPLTDQVRDRAEGVRERAGEVVGKASDTVGDVADQAQSTAGEVTSQVQETVGDLARQTRYQYRRVEDRVQSTLWDNPLAVGAAALAVGAALGLTLPGTRREQELMGGTAESVVEQARGTAEQMVHKAQRVADDVQDTAKQSAKEQGLTE